MTYSIRVPPGWDPATGGTMVLGLHGQGGDHRRFLVQLEPLECFARSILVVPNATRNAAWDENDVDLVADLALEVKRVHGVRRTIAFGFSRGAYLGFGLALRRPDAVQAVIPHSGGLVGPAAGGAAAKKVAFYVIHRDRDDVVPVEQSREAVRALEGAGHARVKYEEVRGLAHLIDRAASGRAVAWIEATLGPAIMPESEAARRIAAVEKAIKAKDDEAAARAVDALDGVPRAAAGKVASLAVRQAMHEDDGVARAAVGAAERLGDAGVPIAMLKKVEGERPAIEKEVQAALARLTGETFASAKEWRRWAAGSGRKG